MARDRQKRGMTRQPFSAARLLLLALFPALFALASPAGMAGEDAGVVPPSEMEALERAISREVNSGALGSQTLGELYRLQRRLIAMRQTARPAAGTAAGSQNEPQAALLLRLEREAAAGGRAARRTLAFYYMYLNEPEKALAQWRLMGKASDVDLSYFIISSYLELALGEYNAGRGNLDTAMRLIDTRTSLGVSIPVFCQNIAGYRVYVPRQPGELLPGEEALIYVELDGVQFSPTPDGGSECAVMFGLRLKDDRQGAVWSDPEYGEYAPVFNGPIRDLHAALSWRVPNDLRPGRYHLYIDAVENSTKRRGEGVTGFNVGRRETNPETRQGRPATSPPAGQGSQSRGYVGPDGNFQFQRDLMRNFPGAPAPQLPLDLSNPNDRQRFEIIREHERNQGVN